MKIGYILKKAVFLIKEIRNPPKFLYLVYHYLKKDMPLKMAMRIATKNKKDYSEIDLIIPTYDGSNQLVHPDCIFFDYNYWFIGTPYPYGMEEYENPCIYRGKSLQELKNNTCPIDTQRKHEIGFHLSDPCLFIYDQELFCAYRENTRERGVPNNYLYVRKLLQNGKWSGRNLVTESLEDPLLSPAFISLKKDGFEELYMYHVKMVGQKSYLVETELDENLSIVLQRQLECLGIPEGYYLWHIAISVVEEGNYRKLKGLFLLKNSYDLRDYALYHAEREDGNCWVVTQQVEISPMIKESILHPYKSCFVPNSNSIIYSFIDNKNRYRLVLIDNN